MLLLLLSEVASSNASRLLQVRVRSPSTRLAINLSFVLQEVEGQQQFVAIKRPFQKWEKQMIERMSFLQDSGQFLRFDFGKLAEKEVDIMEKGEERLRLFLSELAVVRRPGAQDVYKPYDVTIECDRRTCFRFRIMEVALEELREYDSGQQQL